ncbi:solute carrier family 29 (equilibrative nucleoside transporter), member 1/2/3, partial [Lecanoromycetidae sp. Uapishka_2]
MERIRSALKRRLSAPVYESINDDEDTQSKAPKQRFSWLEYTIFLLLGVSMLWAWNMFLAASPYFQHRFRSSPSLLATFPSALISVSCFTNLASMLLLTKLQAGANYPNRIILSLVLNIVAFTLLALSTVLFRGVSAAVYFGFLMAIVFTASLATGFCQNGVFAYVSGFGVSEYTQAIMTGQAIAGVLPCIAQIVSVLSVAAPKNDNAGIDDGEPNIPQESGKSAFAYFLTATAVSVATLAAFLLLVRRHPDAGVDIKSPNMEISAHSDAEPPARKVVGLWALFNKLHYLSTAIFLTFAVTMFFPVFTQQITSVRPADIAPRILQPACFIPLAFLFWNAGDLAGRLFTLAPPLALVRWPRTVFVMSIVRVVFIPLYFLCNIHGQGAVLPSDAFYLIIVQLLFGLSNGYLGSTCMMGVAEWVEVEEREAAGGFMGLMLVGGLTVGSLLSFLVA